MKLYRIVYGPEVYRQAHPYKYRRLILTGILFLMFCLSVCVFWPEGRSILRILLIPGDPDVTLQAAEVFAAELSSGYDMKDAARNFLETVTDYGIAG